MTSKLTAEQIALDKLLAYLKDDTPGAIFPRTAVQQAIVEIERLRSLQIPEEPTGWRPISFQDVMESEGSIVMLHPGTKAIAFYIADGIHASFTLPPLDRAMLRATRGKT